jgi:hypothetical protein
MSPSSNRDGLFAAECCVRVLTLANIHATRLRSSQSWFDVFGRTLKSVKLLMSLVTALEAIRLGLPEPSLSKSNTLDEGLETFLLRLENLCTVCH